MTLANLNIILPYAGALPFMACALLPFLGMPDLPLLGTTAYVAAAYGVVITCFMAGVHWGQYLQSDGQAPLNLFIASNVIAVTVWLGFLALPLLWFLFLLIAVFYALLIIDHTLFKHEQIEKSYFTTRVIVTKIVNLCLLITIVNLF